MTSLSLWDSSILLVLFLMVQAVFQLLRGATRIHGKWLTDFKALSLIFVHFLFVLNP